MVTSDELTACHRCLNDHRPRFGRDEGGSADALTMIDRVLLLTVVTGDDGNRFEKHVLICVSLDGWGKYANNF